MPTQINRRSSVAQLRAVKNENRPLGTRTRRSPAFAEVVPVLPRYPWYLAIKTGLDRLAGLLLLVLALPIIAVASALVKLSTRGPAFYSQERVGRGGRTFTIYKIRTMIHNCESLTGPRWSIPGDPRITWLGRFLRISHLDELPQLINVIRGDMSLIGPRPERPEFLPELVEAFPSYAERLRVRPGVTGLAQVQLPADTDLESVERKLAYDLYYVQHANPWFDLRILLSTALYVARAPYDMVRLVFRLPSAATVERSVRGVLSVGVVRQRMSA